MAKKTIKAQMKQRRDTKANWEATNPVLLDGEFGIVSDDPNLYKVGDGATAWNSLPFRGFDGTLAQELGTSPNAVISQKAVTDKLNNLSQSQIYSKGLSKSKEGESGASIDIKFAYKVGDTLYWKVEDSVSRVNYIYLFKADGSSVSLGSGNEGSVVLTDTDYTYFRAYANSSESANGRKVTIYAKPSGFDFINVTKRATNAYNASLKLSISDAVLDIVLTKQYTGGMYLYWEQDYISISEQSTSCELNAGMHYIFVDGLTKKIKTSGTRNAINAEDILLAAFYSESGRISFFSWVSPICDISAISIDFAPSYANLKTNTEGMQTDINGLKKSALYGIGISKSKEGESGASIDIPFSYNIGDTLYWKVEDSVSRTNYIYLFKADGSNVSFGSGNTGSLVLTDSDYTYFRAFANSSESANGRKVTIWAQPKILETSITPGGPKALSVKTLQRVGCIGDSYTEGYVKVGEDITYGSPNNAWPHYMEGLTNNKYENWGVSGSTAKGWVLGAANLSKVKQEGNKCQAYIIGLMINDRTEASWNPYYTPVGAIEDIGTDADSYYAYYYKLIQEVVAVNPQAKIFCNTCPKWGANDAYNTAVRNIVAYCKNEGQNVYLCDLASDTYAAYFNDKTFTSDAINGHYTSIGYEYMAECLVYIISDVINANIKDFQDLTFITFDPATE